MFDIARGKVYVEYGVSKVINNGYREMAIVRLRSDRFGT